MKKIYKIFIISTVLALCSSLYMSAQEFIVIVNQDNPTSSLTKKQISDYFLKRKTKWSDNSLVNPIDLNSKSPVRQNFSKSVHKKDVSQIRAFWQQSAFSGKASPPPEKQTDNDVVNYVKAHKGAIGYVSSNSSISGVKKITVN